MSVKSGRAYRNASTATAAPVAKDARIAFHTATPARARSPAPINWLTYAESPVPNTSLSEYTHQSTNTDVVTAAVACTPRSLTHTASIHW